MILAKTSTRLLIKTINKWKNQIYRSIKYIYLKIRLWKVHLHLIIINTKRLKIDHPLNGFQLSHSCDCARWQGMMINLVLETMKKNYWIERGLQVQTYIWERTQKLEYLHLWDQSFLRSMYCVWIQILKTLLFQI